MAFSLRLYHTHKAPYIKPIAKASLVCLENVPSHPVSITFIT